MHWKHYVHWQLGWSTVEKSNYSSGSATPWRMLARWLRLLAGWRGLCNLINYLPPNTLTLQPSDHLETSSRGNRSIIVFAPPWPADRPAKCYIPFGENIRTQGFHRCQTGTLRCPGNTGVTKANQVHMFRCTSRSWGAGAQRWKSGASPSVTGASVFRHLRLAGASVLGATGGV